MRDLIFILAALHKYLLRIVMSIYVSPLTTITEEEMPKVELKCVGPECGKFLTEQLAWLPGFAAMRRANKGRSVRMEDFSKFTLCGRCGHLLRKEGVRVFHYAKTVACEEKRIADQKAVFKPFADMFKPKEEREK